MNLAPATLPLKPLRGRLGLREIYFTRKSSPILPHLKTRRNETIAACLAAALVAASIGFLMYLIATSNRSFDPLKYAGILMLISWISTQSTCMLYGFLLPLTRRLHVWNRPGRLAELSLTDLRPIEIAQFMIARSQFQIRLMIAIVYIGVTGTACFMRVSILPAFALVFVALDVIFTCTMWGWGQAALFLGTKSWLERLYGSLNFAMMYAFCAMPALILSITAIVQLIRGRHSVPMALALPLFIWTWLIQYLFARGWALRIERAIFNRIEF